ncbi:MAG: glycosyltransferase family 39 protein [Pelobium sp.]
MEQSIAEAFKSKQPKKILLIFLGLVFLLNLLQAYLTGLHPDEAYYWIYSKFLDWGYFDHPPMVAIFIKLGDSLFQNTLGLRLLTVISHIGSLFLLWLIVKKYTSNIKLFILGVTSILIFHVYAFITTPDVPLMFFSVLFLYTYQIYLKEDKLKWALLLGLISAALLMSKYHGVLLIFFILISNLQLFKRKSFYATLVFAIVLCLPHLYWQYLNGYPSFYYHLIDRSATPYRFSYTSQYFLDQLLMMGPLVGWLFFYYGYQLKTVEDQFLNGLKFVFYGVFIFFFLSTFKGRVQAQWPLIEYIALFILAYIYAGKNLEHFSKFKWLFGINIILILLARFILMGAIPFANKIKFVASFQNYDVWAKEIAAIAGDHPVIFKDGFQAPSYYNYYTQSLKAIAYNSINYRQTQYDLWPLEDSIQHKKVLLVTPEDGYSKTGINLQTAKGVYNLQWLDGVRFYPKINFNPLHFPKDWKVNEERLITFEVKNPYAQSVNFSDQNEKWTCSFQYGFMEEGKIFKLTPFESELKQAILKAGETKKIQINIKSPSKPGDYKLFLSIKTQPFAGTRNSKMISVKVK